MFPNFVGVIIGKLIVPYGNEYMLATCTDDEICTITTQTLHRFLSIIIVIIHTFLIPILFIEASVSQWALAILFIINTYIVIISFLSTIDKISYFAPVFLEFILGIHALLVFFIFRLVLTALHWSGLFTWCRSAAFIVYFVSSLAQLFSKSFFRNI